MRLRSARNHHPLAARPNPQIRLRNRLQPRRAKPVHSHPRHIHRQTRPHRRPPRNIPPLLALRLRASQNHIFDLSFYPVRAPAPKLRPRRAAAKSSGRVVERAPVARALQVCAPRSQSQLPPSSPAPSASACSRLSCLPILPASPAQSCPLRVLSPASPAQSTLLRVKMVDRVPIDQRVRQRIVIHPRRPFAPCLPALHAPARASPDRSPN